MTQNTAKPDAGETDSRELSSGVASADLSGVSVDTWLALLSELTDRELAKYGEIARDQRNLELKRIEIQILCGFLMVLTLVISLNEGLNYGMTALTAGSVTLTGGLGFWLFQKSRTRRFWNKHCKAVANEKERRAAMVEAEAD